MRLELWAFPLRLQGKQMPYREALLNGKVVVQTYADVLSRHSPISCREERGDVDSVNFLNLSRLLVESVRDLTAGDRKIVLIYDSYRFHLSLEVLQLFR